MEALYPEMKRLAVERLAAAKADGKWKPAELVDQLHSELKAKREEQHPVEDRAAFFGLASHIMNRLLVGHARRYYRRAGKAPLEELEQTTPSKEPLPDSVSKVEKLLAKLEAINPRIRTVVELRVFEGLSGDEIAERLGCGRRTVIRDWSFAKELIAEELGGEAK